MSSFLHFLSHAVLKTQKDNLRKIQDKLEDHHRAHDDEKKAQERARQVQAQLSRIHAAVKLHAFHRQLTGKMAAMKQQQDRQQVQALMDKIGRVESGQIHLHQAMSKKAVAHQDVEKHLLSLKTDVDDALKALDKLKKK